MPHQFSAMMEIINPSIDGHLEPNMPQAARQYWGLNVAKSRLQAVKTDK
jgi:hypothetical protein